MANVSKIYQPKKLGNKRAKPTKAMIRIDASQEYDYEANFGAAAKEIVGEI